MGAHRTFESNFSTTGPFHISRCPQSLWFLESLDPIFLEDFLKRFLEKEGVEGRSLLTRRGAFAGWSPSLKRVFDQNSIKRVTSTSQLSILPCVLLLGLTSTWICRSLFIRRAKSLDLNLTLR